VIFAGIDPGQGGAIVALDEDCRVLLAVPLPHEQSPAGKGGIVAVRELRSVLAQLGPLDLALLETVQSPRAGGRQVGGAAGLAIGVGWGRLSATLDLLGVPWEPVAASAWHRAMVGSGEGDAKARALAACVRLLPGLDLCPGRRRAPHPGIVDAALIALYARRRHMGGELWRAQRPEAP